MHDEATQAPAQTFVESSRNGALMVELDESGFVVRCQIEPEVNRTWTSELLAQRVIHLYQLALMRARFEQLRRINERGGDVTPGEVYPTVAEINEYRRLHLDF